MNKPNRSPSLRPPEYDLVVVGGGIVGVASGALASVLGYRVLLLDDGAPWSGSYASGHVFKVRGTPKQRAQILRWDWREAYRVRRANRGDRSLNTPAADQDSGKAEEARAVGSLREGLEALWAAPLVVYPSGRPVPNVSAVVVSRTVIEAARDALSDGGGRVRVTRVGWRTDGWTVEGVEAESGRPKAWDTRTVLLAAGHRAAAIMLSDDLGRERGILDGGPDTASGQQSVLSGLWGVSFRVRAERPLGQRVLAKFWAPFRQVMAAPWDLDPLTGQPADDRDLWAGDGSTLKTAVRVIAAGRGEGGGLEAAAAEPPHGERVTRMIAAAKDRVAKTLRQDFGLGAVEIVEERLGIRPIVDRPAGKLGVQRMPGRKISFAVGEIDRGCWIVTGVGKSGLMAAGWAADKIVGDWLPSTLNRMQ